MEASAAALGAPTGDDAMRDAVRDPWPAPGAKEACKLVLLVSSAPRYADRRRAIRETYLRVVRGTQPGAAVEGLEVRFLVGQTPDQGDAKTVEDEGVEFGDIVRCAVWECYDNLFAKLIAGYRWVLQHYETHYVAHADDDSFVRPERLLADVEAADESPGSLYWGYFWNLDGGGGRTAPIRDPSSKSFCPVDQWPQDTYPPFASGCCFALSTALVKRVFVDHSDVPPGRHGALTFIRNFDAPVGVALAMYGGGAVRYVHSAAVRPYRPLPLFRPDTTVQHYIRPEEMRAFFQRAYPGERDAAATDPGGGAEERIHGVYEMLVRARVLRR